MRATVWCRRCGLSAAVVLVLAAWYVGAGRQDGTAANTAQAPAGPTKLYFGVDACVDCHSQGTKRKPVLCLCTEVAQWKDKDKHQEAWLVLKSKRAEDMGLVLWGKKDVTHEKRCISCHGIDVTDPKRVDGGDIDKVLADGVSCAVCHGPYREWVKEHRPDFEDDRKKWRALTRKDKETHYGMTDLWDPVRRAEVCFSCHIGNSKEGKVVTHEMYAAGHPPLPGVEIATFSEQMPRHWQLLRDKTPEVQKLLQFKPDEPQFEQTRTVVVSGLVALREAMNLLAEQAQADGGKAWPELAQFDCYACHHDLKTPSWRQQRGYVGKPGRPQMRPWPLELARLGLRHGGKDVAQLDVKMTEVTKAFDARPFGKPQDIAVAAKDVVQWCDAAMGTVTAKECDRETGLGLLGTLCALTDKDIPDYDSARQIVWAFRILYEELPKPKPENDAKIRQILEGLERELKAKLPAGKEQSILGQLPDGLKKLNEYDPFVFKKSIAELAKLLPTQ